MKLEVKTSGTPEPTMFKRSSVLEASRSCSNAFNSFEAILPGYTNVSRARYRVQEPFSHRKAVIITSCLTSPTLCHHHSECVLAVQLQKT